MSGREIVKICVWANMERVDQEYVEKKIAGLPLDVVAYDYCVGDSRNTTTPCPTTTTALPEPHDVLSWEENQR